MHQIVPRRRRWPPAGCATTGATTPIGYFAPHAGYCGAPAAAGRRSTSSRRWCDALHARRPRGDPRRRLQPHRRGRPRGPTLCLRGIDNAAYYRLSPRTRAATWTTPAAATRSTSHRPADAAPGHGLAALLGARRCTSTASASTSRRRSGAAPSDFDPHVAVLRPPSARTRCSRSVKLIAEPWDVGRRRLRRRATSRRLERVERPLPRHRARLLARPPRAAARLRHPPRPARPTCTGAAGAGPPRRSTSSPPTTASPWPTSSRYDAQAQRGQRRGQPRRHRRQPLAGTAASRARPTTPTILALRGAPAAQPARHAAAVARRADAARRRRARPHPAAATTTPTARTTRTSWFDWEAGRRRGRAHRLRRAPLPPAPRASGAFAGAASSAARPRARTGSTTSSGCARTGSP